MYGNNKWPLLVLGIVGLSFMIPFDSATVRSFPFFMLCLYCLMLEKYWNVFRERIFQYLLVGSVLTFSFHGFLETKDLIMYVVCLSGISYISERFEFKPMYLYVFFGVFILGSSLMHFAMGDNVTWIPYDGMINIFGVGTKHGTAIAGVILLLPTLAYLYERYKGLPVELSLTTLISLFILSVYLVVFSSSRSTTLAVIMICLYLWINRVSFRKKFSICFFCVCNASVFFLEYVADYIGYINDIPWLAEFVHTDNFEQYGVTSGRAWLWGVHMHSFFTSPFLMGGGRAVTDFFVGDWLPWLGVQAQAGSESVYTGYLACYGLVGVGLILIQLALFLIAVKKEAILASAIMFFMIYNTTMGVSLVTSYNYAGILCYFLYFMYLNKSDSYKQFGVKI